MHQAPPPPRVLVADDQTDILQALRLLLVDAGVEPELVTSIEGVRDRLAGATYDLLLMDLNYTRDTTSGREGLDLITEVRARDRHLPIVVMTGWGSIDTAVEAMRRGARSFVQKPWDDLTLVEVVKREIADGVSSRRADARLEREQEEARLIQRALLPTTLPALEGVRIAAMWNPASGFGGDCYDVIRFNAATPGAEDNAERVGITVADVAGKGLPAALLMSNLQAAVRAFASEASTPQQVATSVNRLLCRNIAVGRFVSFCYLVIDRSRGLLTFANAGHNPPLLVRGGGEAARLLSGGMVLGVMPDATYDQLEVAVAPGDRLILYTDGIIEAENAAGEDYGEHRLSRVAAAHSTGTPQHILDAIFEDVSLFAAGRFEDDATLIVAAID
ncbi:MAG TPA: SpoIIE family protein phosphatase [Vicinamibacterales bacterium]|nr:SpoIIE family protein phosphatase [Vicinamibacterales bacterium]